jgi:hypothetical protein
MDDHDEIGSPACALPPPRAEALASAIATLRENLAFREEVSAPSCPSLIPAAVLNQDGSVDISYIPSTDLREYLRVLQAQEAAAAAATEALR